MSGPRLEVDPDDPTPPYEQLRRQLEDAVGSGTLAAGDRLPPLRQLAGDLGLAVGTVARAYREAEQQGLLVSRRGGGTRVAQSADRFTATQRRERLRDLSSSYVARARALGADEDEIEEHVRRQLGRPAR